MPYALAFVGLSVQADRGDPMPLTSGYQARAWLPAYDVQQFDTVADAEAWIEANQRGPDLATVQGLFHIVEV
jgi:hypothetical protein